MNKDTKWRFRRHTGITRVLQGPAGWNRMVYGWTITNVTTGTSSSESSPATLRGGYGDLPDLRFIGCYIDKKVIESADRGMPDSIDIGGDSHRTDIGHTKKEHA